VVLAIIIDRDDGLVLQPFQDASLTVKAFTQGGLEQ
jgi:hypothetical protein